MDFTGCKHMIHKFQIPRHVLVALSLCSGPSPANTQGRRAFPSLALSGRGGDPRVSTCTLGTGQPGGQPHPSGLSAHTDRTWTYSFSGVFLFSMGFLVAGLCYLSYRYVTKPPTPPNSLVSIRTWDGVGSSGEASQQQRTQAQGPLARSDMQRQAHKAEN